jgi:hypothetical protein
VKQKLHTDLVGLGQLVLEHGDFVLFLGELRLKLNLAFHLLALLAAILPALLGDQLSAQDVGLLAQLAKLTILGLSYLLLHQLDAALGLLSQLRQRLNLPLLEQLPRVDIAIVIGASLLVFAFVPAAAFAPLFGGLAVALRVLVVSGLAFAVELWQLLI